MLALIVLLAVLVEGLVEHAKNTVNLTPLGISLAKYTLGLVAAFGFGLVMFSEFAAAAGVEPVWWIDQAFTGLAIGTGSSFIHELVNKLSS